MHYTTDRLPKDLAIAVGGGFAAALLGGLLTSFEAGREFARDYPHDGQDGLGALAAGIFSLPLWFLIVAVLLFAARLWQYRKLSRLEGEAAFQTELLAARESTMRTDSQQRG